MALKPETKKILLIGGAGLAGIAVIWYLLQEQSATAANQAISPAGTQPLTVPTPGDITFNYPPLSTPPTPLPPAACTTLCETCDDSFSYAGTAQWRISPATVSSQYANLQSIGQQTISRASYTNEYVSGLAGVTEQVYSSGG